VFRRLPPVEREEAIAEAVAAAFVAYRRLCDRGIDPVREFPSMMATFATRQVKDGRHVGSRMSSKDVLSGMLHCRDEAMATLPEDPSPEVRTAVEKAVDIALHNVCDMLEGFWRLEAGPNHTISLALVLDLGPQHLRPSSPRVRTER